jgi:hypothetical protein
LEWASRGSTRILIVRLGRAKEKADMLMGCPILMEPPAIHILIKHMVEDRRIAPRGNDHKMPKRSNDKYLQLAHRM